jgi:HEAT repeat protein
MVKDRLDPSGRMSLAAVAFVVGAIAIFGALKEAWGQEPSPASTAPATSQAASAPVDSARLASLWEDFIHGIKVAREEMALSNGQAILEQSAAAREVYLLSVKTGDVDAVLARGEKLAGMAPVIEGIRKLIERGYHAERSDPTQIANSIDMLPKSLRAYEIAASRLAVSGEYAMPQLIAKLTSPQTPASLVERIVTVLPRVGKEAVRPLCEALGSSDDRLLEIVANALGQIRYPDAAPYLKELLERQGVLDRTRQIVTAALMACAGREALDKPVASLFYEQAEKYYYQRPSVTPDERMATANVWYWREGLGLDFRTVPREIFGDIYAMRLARQALKHDASFYPAVSLWLAAKLRNEIDLPLGARDPTEEAGQPTARFYALAGSAKYLQDVLSRALRDRDGALAVRAIEALSRTAGAGSLVEPVAGGVQPLVEALTNPDREVRFRAAVTLASAMPHKRFNGDEIVIAVLNEALRQSAGKRALVIASDQDQRNLLMDAARTAGYEVIDQPDPAKALRAAQEAQGVDMILLGKNPPAADVLRTVRAEVSLAAVPVVAASASSDLQALARSDGRVVTTDESASTVALTAAMAEAAKTTGATPLSAEQAATWSIGAAEAIRMLGMTGNPVYDISRTCAALSALLADRNAEVMMAAARALAAMGGAGAQQALAAAALEGKTAEQDRIGFFKVLGESLRRFGNQLTDQQAQAVVEVVTDAKQPQAVRDAAAEVLGAMDLPSEKIKSLILESPEPG